MEAQWKHSIVFLWEDLVSQVVAAQAYAVGWVHFGTIACLCATNLSIICIDKCTHHETAGIEINDV